MISDWTFKKSLNACLCAYIINVVVYQTHWVLKSFFTKVYFKGKGKKEFTVKS